jgi:hypothetical protein
MNDETKRCPKCEIELSIDLFNRRNGGRKISSYCKACQSNYSRSHYISNTPYYSAKRLKSQREIYRRNMAYVLDFLRINPCVECGERDPVVLDFDHVLPKNDNISNLARQGASIGRLRAEMDRCVVRCAKCHRRRTAVQFNWSGGTNG